jgi:hypothetical protein
MAASSSTAVNLLQISFAIITLPSTQDNKGINLKNFLLFSLKTFALERKDLVNFIGLSRFHSQ